MKKRLLLLIAAMCLLLTGCAVDATGSWYQEHYIVDEETGVNYLYVNSDSGCSVCPRYNADGTLYTK